MSEATTAPILSAADLSLAQLYAQKEGSPVSMVRVPMTSILALITSAASGYKEYATIALRNADTQPNGRIGYVFANNGDPADPLNGYYQADDSDPDGWVAAPWVANFFAPAVQPLADLSAAWAEGTEPGGPGTKSSKEHAEDVAGLVADAQAVTGSHVIAFGVTGEGQAIHGSALASPAARYAATVDGSNYLDVEFIAAAVERVAWLKKAGGQKVGRTFSATFEFPATNFSGTNAAAGFVFTDKAVTGSQANAGADAYYLYVRANGAAQLVNDAGGAVSGYTLTVGSVAVPTFTGGDVVTATYKRNMDDSGTLTFQKGATISTVTIAPAPPQAYVAAMVRSAIAGTGTPGSGSNYHAKIRTSRWDDATIEQNISQVTQQQYLGTALPSALPSLGSPIEPAVDAMANTPRAMPTPLLGKLPILPVQVVGPGKVVLNRTAIEAMALFFPAVAGGNIAYVSPTGGSPGTAALNDRTKPYSLSYAVKTLTTANIIVALPGDYAPIDFRNTDAAAAMAKLVLADIPGKCRLRVAATDNLSTQTWTTTGGYSGIWETTYAGTYGSPAIHRMCRTDLLDAWGYPAQLLRCASLAALDAAAQGFYVDTAAKKVYVKLTGGISVEANKAFLAPKWIDAAGFSRVYQQGTVLGLSGFRVDGLEFVANIGSGGQRPWLFLDLIEQLWSSNYGVNDIGGDGEPYFFATRWRSHAPAADGLNFGEEAALAGASLANIGNCWFSDDGAFSGLGVNGSANKQSISMHGGNIAAFGCLFEDSYGQCVADTSTDPSENYSLYVGCLARRRAALTGSAAFSFYGKGSAGSGNRKIWIDSCEAEGPFDAELHLQDYASGKILNTSLAVSLGANSVMPTAYTADNPGA